MCINKTNRTNPHERISHIGGVQRGKRWKLTEAEAIAAIEADKWRFGVCEQGLIALVIVAAHLGRKYLKTEADGITPDNLLALPECP